MNVPRFFRFGVVGIGGIIVGLLALGFYSTPTIWLQDRLIESLGVNVAKMHGEQPTGDLAPIQLTKNLPAAKQAAPEEIQAQQHPLPPGKPEDFGRSTTKGQMIQNCMQQPLCRQRLQEAKSGKRPVKGRPAATQPSPEEQEQKKLPPPAIGTPQGPMSDLPSPSGSSLVAWLNPFQPSVAEAQDFSLALNPFRYNQFKSAGWMATYGGYQWRSQYPIIGPNYPWNTSWTENKSYVHYVVVAPSSGWYLLEIRAGSAQTKLRHQYNGPIIGEWDHTNTSCTLCYYTTVEYLEAGNQYFYFWSVANNPYVYGVTVESYP